MSRVIAATPEAVYAFASNVDNLPTWAAGLALVDVTRDGDTLLVESPMGHVQIHFAERNSLGVLDHDVTLPSGKVVANPFRVVSHPEGAEVIFTVRQMNLDDAEFSADVDTVAADLDRLASHFNDSV